ncbi:MAG: RNA polymerase sigma factor SigM [Candidatus Nanopelagicales bacterium]|nr:RNA polymerase sigma factor SigM [Candidatus Nanopelagicales bacterium]MCF8551700.1 RNA polymerase sigma factor SigM [Candidatus Nanopelagicales bacterium]
MPGTGSRGDDPGLYGGLSDLTDRELLSAHISGNPQAFNVLVSRHRDRLWSVALRTTGDPEEAADSLQDALISAFRRADQYRGDAAVTTWLHRIVVNASLDRLRRKAVRPTTTLPDHYENNSVEIPETRDHMSERETMLEISTALAELPPDQREAVVLIDIEGYSIDDAAAQLNCPPGTVKSRSSRGRAKLAERLSYLRNQDPTDTVTRSRGGVHDNDVS